VEDETLHPFTFTKNRERFLEGDTAQVLAREVADEAKRRQPLTQDYFSIDGTLLRVRASRSSYRPHHGHPT